MAGAGYKLFNTGDVLTAAQVNTYLQEQVVMVFANSTARTTALSGVLAEGMVSYLKDTDALEIYSGSAWVGYGSGDITGVTAGTGISGGGTSGTVTITNSMATEITAAGDIIVGTGSGTFDNLPIGTTGQVLTADTTVSPYKVKWASASSGGGWTSLYTITMSGAAVISQTVDFTGYREAVIEYENVTCGSTWNLQTKLNNSTTDLYVQVLSNDSTNVVSSTATSFVQTGSGGAQTSARLDGTLIINNPASTSAYKAVDYTATYTRNAAGSPLWSLTNKGFFRSASAITSIYFDSNSGNFTGGTVRIYGVK